MRPPGLYPVYPADVFVTLEGPEGAGKSTVGSALRDALEALGHTVCLTREPGSGPVGQRIRSILLDEHNVTSRCELFLFLADRSEHVATIIRPALERGEIVVCDRHADSTIVYQGYARGLDIDLLKAWNAFATNGMRPDLTLLLDLPAEAGLARQTHKDRLDLEPLEFHQKVREGFLSEAALEPERWKVIDAAQPTSDVVAACLCALHERWPGL